MKTLVRDAFLDLGAALSTGAGVMLLGTVLLAIAYAFTARDPRDLFSDSGLPWAIVAVLLATQLPLLYFALRRRRRNREKQRPALALFGGSTAVAILQGISAGLALTILSGLYAGTLQWILGPNAVDNQLEFLQDILDNKPAVALLVFIITVVAPICEELFFRGAIFGSAHAAGLSRVGLAISAILFAAMHLSPLLAPFYATFAVVMCWLYTRTGTLAAPIAAHMTLNSVACAAFLSVAGNRV
jgi:membrane protease YdiL (CAAX protease family)